MSITEDIINEIEKEDTKPLSRKEAKRTKAKKGRYLIAEPREETKPEPAMIEANVSEYRIFGLLVMTKVSFNTKLEGEL